MVVSFGWFGDLGCLWSGDSVSCGFLWFGDVLVGFDLRGLRLFLGFGFCCGVGII